MTRTGRSEAVSEQDRVRQHQIERQAEGYLDLGMTDHALSTLARAGERLSAHGHYLQGEALRAAERYAEALPPLRRAAQRMAGKITPVWLALAWCYKRTAQLSLAIDAMERALEDEPREALLHYNLACYLSLARAPRRALAHLSRAFGLDPHYRAMVDGESDFDPIRSDPQFQALTSVTA
jgi:tetratricopeptide (TPR) repeat protein